MSITIFQGEGKWFPFLMVDLNGDPVDVSGLSFLFHVKAAVEDAAPLFEANEWDETEAAIGIVKANLPAAQTLLMEEGTYLAQLLTVVVADTDVDISDVVKFKIKKPVVFAP